MESFKEYIKKHLAFIILIVIVWILGELFIVAPISVCIAKSVVDGHVADQATFISSFFEEFSNFYSYFVMKSNS